MALISAVIVVLLYSSNIYIYMSLDGLSSVKLLKFFLRRPLFCLRRHPQLLVFPVRIALTLASKIRPQSHCQAANVMDWRIWV